jgi:beta-N-acetylhexosaminidase
MTCPRARRRLPDPRSWTLPLLVPILVLAGCTTAQRIRDRPISFSDWRRDATLSYISAHYGRDPVGISITPRIIVLHWTAVDDLEETFTRFDPEELPARRADLGGPGQVNVSSHFLVDRDGTIYRLMPESWMARHVIGLNLSAVGVENVGGSGNVDNMTERQIASNIRLVRYLKKKYPSIEYLIGHAEYREFEGHPLWLEMDDEYRTEKSDPGDRMMEAVRTAVSDLGLKGIAEVREEREAARPPS